MLVLGGLVAVSASCAGEAEDSPRSISTGAGQSSDVQRPLPGDFAVSYETPDLADVLTFGRLQSRRRSVDGALVVRIAIHNGSARELRLSVQLEFLDRRSAFYGDRTTRRVITVGSRQTAWFEATSTREKACELVLRVGRL